MTQPLGQMTRAVESFAGNQPAVVPTSASGEIGVLAKAFARMDAEVREKTAALTREIEERSRLFEPPDVLGNVNLLDRRFEPASCGLFNHAIITMPECEPACAYSRAAATRCA